MIYCTIIVWISEHQQRRCFAFGLIAVTPMNPCHPPPPPPTSVMNEWLTSCQRTFVCLFLNLQKNFCCRNNKVQKNNNKEIRPSCDLTAGPNLDLKIVFFPFFVFYQTFLISLMFKRTCDFETKQKNASSSLSIWKESNNWRKWSYFF